MSAALAIASTRAPERPNVANFCFAASRMRQRVPAGSRFTRSRFMVAASFWECKGELRLPPLCEHRCYLRCRHPSGGCDLNSPSDPTKKAGWPRRALLEYELVERGKRRSRHTVSNRITMSRRPFDGRQNAIKT